MNPPSLESRSSSFSQDHETSLVHGSSIPNFDIMDKTNWSPMETTDSQSNMDQHSFVKFTAFSGLNSNDMDFEVSHKNMLNSEHKNRLYKEELLIHEHLRCEVFGAATKLTNFYKFSDHTRYLCLSYIDAVLAKYTIITSQINVLAYCSLILAAKLEEKYGRLPKVDEGLEILPDVDSREAIFHYERYIFQSLNFEINLKTPFSFLSVFLQKGVVTEPEIAQAKGQKNHSGFEETFKKLALFFLEASVQRYHFSKYKSSVVAVSVIFLTRGCLGLKGLTPRLETQLRTCWDEIKECVTNLLNLTKHHNLDFAQKFNEGIKIVEKDISFRNMPPIDLFSPAIQNEKTHFSQKKCDPETSSEIEKKTDLKKRISKKTSKNDVKNFRSSERENLDDLDKSFNDLNLKKMNSTKNISGQPSWRRNTRKLSKL